MMSGGEVGHARCEIMHTLISGLQHAFCCCLVAMWGKETRTPLYHKHVLVPSSVLGGTLEEIVSGIVLQIKRGRVTGCGRCPGYPPAHTSGKTASSLTITAFHPITLHMRPQLIHVLYM
jgi:hypothetical protein